MPIIYKNGQYYGQAGIAGHAIVDANDNTLTQRTSLQFGGDMDVSDDASDDVTIVKPHLLTSSDISEIMENPPLSPFIGLNLNGPVYASTPRWLRFDPSNKKGLIIKAGTNIKKSDGNYQTYLNDIRIDFTSSNLVAGKDYFVNLADDGTITCSQSKLGTGITIGRFHTLCANIGTITMIAPASPSSGITVGSNFLVKSYTQEDDPDFYDFYNKSVTAVSAGTPYDVITCTHPLSGYSAGDILPESVFCLSWKPKTRFEDAMVYDVDTNICVDVYLQSGTGLNTRSAYNATHTVSRQAFNHQGDMLQVGKQLLSDQEFTSMALGSNECTNITGSSDKTYVGGHADTNSRRMISAIGCEECCGYLWQWLSDVGFNGQTTWKTTDGRALFGQEYGEPYILLAGGAWGDSGSCGSRARNCANVRSNVHVEHGARGRANIKILI